FPRLWSTIGENPFLWKRVPPTSLDPGSAPRWGASRCRAIRYPLWGGAWRCLGSAAYHAAKWAVGGVTESLAQEVAPFGVKVCALEPGGMRTNWGARALKAEPTGKTALPLARE